MQPDLPDSYYLDNVLVLFDHVEQLYSDLMDAELLAFLERFATSSIDCQKLYIRLLNRRGTLFRQQKLDYAEIGSMTAAASAGIHFRPLDRSPTSDRRGQSDRRSCR